MTHVGTLTQLLCSLFSTEELRSWLVFRQATAHFGHTILFNAPPIVVCRSVAEALERETLADDAFFVDLERARPRRKAEIHAEAARWRPAPSAAPNAAPSPTPNPAPSPARILHLSDLHARSKTEWDARALLLRLTDAVRKLREEGLGPDLVAITGDIAHGGLAREYALVEHWLKEHLLPAAGLDTDALLIVPGNHDVDRRACASVSARAVEDALSGGDQAKVAEVLRDPGQRKLIYARYKSYLAFLNRLGVAHNPAPRWSTRREVRGLGLHLVGLDTAWLASGEASQGRLVLGLAALNDVLPPPPPNSRDLVVALAHHPMSWLVERDQAAVVPPLRARAHLLLRGHLHDPDYTLTISPQQRLIELPAGASYAGHGFPMSFQLIELDPAKVRVHLYTWRPEWDGWVPDRTRLPPDGVVELALR